MISQHRLARYQYYCNQIKHSLNEVRCYEAQIEESEKGRQPPGVKPRTSLA